MKIGRNNPCPCGSGKKYKKCCLKKEKNFLIGEDLFYSQIKPLYKNAKFDINRFLEFEISLPFQLALEDKSLFSFKKENCILHYFYKTHEREEVIVEHEDLFVKKHYTSVIVAISYNFDEYKNDTNEAIQNKLFDYSLEELNKQIIAYSNYTKDDSCFRLSKEMLFPIILMNLVNLEVIKNEMSIFMLHMDVPYKKESLKNEDIYNWLRIYNVYNENLNPLVHSESYVLKARRKFREGFYDEAVISIQTSIEVLIRIIYREVLICSGISEIEVEKILEDESFMSIVKKQLAKYIGGTWDITREETPIYNWYNDTYNMRNKIVHGGYFPTFKETDNAISAATEFREYIFNRIREKKKEYSKLNEYFK